jgi:hypothetical protein
VNRTIYVPVTQRRATLMLSSRGIETAVLFAIGVHHDLG